MSSAPSICPTVTGNWVGKNCGRSSRRTPAVCQDENEDPVSSASANPTGGVVGIQMKSDADCRLMCALTTSTGSGPPTGAPKLVAIGEGKIHYQVDRKSTRLN